MEHNLTIRVSKKPEPPGVVRCCKVSVRERILRFLLGDKQKLTVLVPGDSVKTLSICEIPEGGAVHESH